MIVRWLKIAVSSLVIFFIFGVPISFASSYNGGELNDNTGRVDYDDGRPSTCVNGITVRRDAVWSWATYGSVPTFCFDGCYSRPNPIALCTGMGNSATCNGSFVSLGNSLADCGLEGQFFKGGSTPPDDAGELLQSNVTFECTGDGCPSGSVMAAFNQLVEGNSKKLSMLINEARTRESEMADSISYVREYLSDEMIAQNTTAFNDKNEIIKEVGDAKDEVIEKLDSLSLGDVDTSGLLTDSKATAMYQDMMSNVMGVLGGINGNTASLPYTLSDLQSNMMMNNQSLQSSLSGMLGGLGDALLTSDSQILARLDSLSTGEVDTSALEGKIDGVADDVGALDGSIKDGVDTLTGAVNGVKDSVDSGFSGLGEKLDGIINGNGNVFSAPSSGGWSSGTSIGDGVTGIKSEIEGLQGTFEQLVKNPPMLMGAVDFNGGSYDGISFDVRGQRVSFNLFGLLGNNINLINSIIIFIATLMAAFIILSAGRNKE